VFQAFLRQQHDEGAALARDSSILDLLPLGDPADRFIARYTCRGLVRDLTGAIAEAEEFAVGIWFPGDYLRRANPFEVLTWLGPSHVWHSNISAPFICVGRLVPGMGLVDLLYQCWQIITWNKATIREDDALNREACEWARHHLGQLPVDTRPLKRRRLDLHLEETPSREEPRS
jgi:hypothetical protein